MNDNSTRPMTLSLCYVIHERHKSSRINVVYIYSNLSPPNYFCYRSHSFWIYLAISTVYAHINFYLVSCSHHSACIRLLLILLFPTTNITASQKKRAHSARNNYWNQTSWLNNQNGRTIKWRMLETKCCLDTIWKLSDKNCL